jgi:hypothetical protein
MSLIDPISQQRHLLEELIRLLCDPSDFSQKFHRFLLVGLCLTAPLPLRHDGKFTATAVIRYIRELGSSMVRSTPRFHPSGRTDISTVGLAVHPASRNLPHSMAIYELSVKIGGAWRWVCSIEADDHPKALRQAIGCLKPEHYSLPIRLEQEVPPPAKEKPRRGRPQ